MANWASEVKSIDWLTESEENHSNIGASVRIHFIDGSTLVETCTVMEMCEDRDHVKFDLTEHELPTHCLSFYFDVVPDGNECVKLTVGKEFDMTDKSLNDMTKHVFHHHLVKIANEIAAHTSVVSTA